MSKAISNIFKIKKWRKKERLIVGQLGKMYSLSNIEFYHFLFLTNFTLDFFYHKIMLKTSQLLDISHRCQAI